MPDSAEQGSAVPGNRAAAGAAGPADGNDPRRNRRGRSCRRSTSTSSAASRSPKCTRWPRRCRERSRPTHRRPSWCSSCVSRYARDGAELTGEGVIEQAKENYAMLRDPARSFRTSPDDLYHRRPPDPRARPAGRPEAPGAAAPAARARQVPVGGRGARDRGRPDRRLPAADALRQAHAAVSRPAPDPRRRGTDASQRAGGRPDRAARARPARADHRPAARRQDDPAQADRPCGARQPPGGRTAHPAARRAARGGDRLRGDLRCRGVRLDLRRAAETPRPGRRPGDRARQAAGRTRQATWCCCSTR